MSKSSTSGSSMEVEQPSSARLGLLPLLGAGGKGSNVKEDEQSYPGSSAKLTELFLYWLSQKETTDLVENCVSAVIQGQPAPFDSSLESPQLTLRGLSGSSPPHASFMTGSNQPPRSPRDSCSSPPSAGGLFLKRPLASFNQNANTSNKAAAAGSNSSPSSTTTSQLASSPPAKSTMSRTAPSSSTTDMKVDGGAAAMDHSMMEGDASSGGHHAVPSTTSPLPGAADIGSSSNGKVGRKGEKTTALSAPRPAAPVPSLHVGLGGTGGRGKAYPEDSLENRKGQLRAMYLRLATNPSQGLSMANFGEFTKQFCRLPSFFKVPLLKRIISLYGGHAKDSIGRPEAAAAEASPPPTASKSTEEDQQQYVSLEVLLKFWAEEMAPYDAIDRLFRVMKQPTSPYLVKEDLMPFLDQLLESHPGLEFLRTHPDFQHKYALTVAARIFYTVNRSGSGKLISKEIRRSKLLEAMRFVDENDDINKETSFFSYEHFYVLYCRFWELDTDRDGFLSKEDLLKYGEHSLSNAIVDRVFEIGARPFADGRGGKKSREKMAYEDFIFFMLSEEDKGNEASMRYWFHCVDVDGDGRISFQDMRYFYNIQLQRMEWLGHELVPFADVLCQMLDLLKPSDKSTGLTIDDFLLPDKIKVAGVFFDALFNLNKFIQFEQRDPFGDRQKREDPFDSDWERFAYRDYQQLAMDEEENDGYAEEMEHSVTHMDIENDGDGGIGGGLMDTSNWKLEDAAGVGGGKGGGGEEGGGSSLSSSLEAPF